MHCTLAELGSRMSAQEFGLHQALADEEPLAPASEAALGSLLASLANGALQHPQKRLWQRADFYSPAWRPRESQAPVAPAVLPTVETIMAAARAAGMN